MPIGGIYTKEMAFEDNLKAAADKRARAEQEAKEQWSRDVRKAIDDYRKVTSGKGN